MRSEYLPVLVINNNLHKSWIISQSKNFSARLEWEFTDFYRFSLLAFSGFREIKGRDLRLAACSYWTIP